LRGLYEYKSQKRIWKLGRNLIEIEIGDQANLVANGGGSSASKPGAKPSLDRHFA
jgi:hypothetical protein